jgi:hypothetical protein
MNTFVMLGAESCFSPALFQTDAQGHCAWWDMRNGINRRAHKAELMLDTDHIHTNYVENLLKTLFKNKVKSIRRKYSKSIFFKRLLGETAIGEGGSRKNSERKAAEGQ